MYYQARYAFIGIVDKLPAETEEDFYMYWSYNHINFSDAMKLSKESFASALRLMCKLDREKLEKGLFKKCKNKMIGNVVCLEKEEFKELIDSIEVVKEKATLKNIFNFLEERNLFESNWIVLNIKGHGEFYYCDEEEEE